MGVGDGAGEVLKCQQGGRGSSHGWCVRVAARVGREGLDLGCGRGCFLGPAKEVVLVSPLEILNPRLEHLLQILCLLRWHSEAQREKLTDARSHS